VQRVPLAVLLTLLAVSTVSLFASWLSRPAAEAPTSPDQPTALQPDFGLSSSDESPDLAPPVLPGTGPAARVEDGHGADEELAALAESGELDAPKPGVQETSPSELAESACDRPAPPPLPQPGSPEAADFWQAFRAPLAPAPVWNPPGPKRVGLQAGHWRVEEVPAELGRLGHGASGGGRSEWEVNLDIARRAAEILRRAGAEVDVLPATLPPTYRAHVFLSIHADGDQQGTLRGYKLARAAFSATPEADDRLVATLYQSYGEATGLPRDDLHISRRMTAYYAFNSRRYCHAIAPGVPGAILEGGFLTNQADRQLLLGNPDAAARGIATGLLRYLGLPS
jgi:N-acetylmuramoyl-L-alanine amidase